MSSAQKIIQAAAGNAGEALYVEDVFSTYLYEGNSSTQTITNGIDLNGEGGLVWIKARTVDPAYPTSFPHNLYSQDSGFGYYYSLESNSTSAQKARTSSLQTFNSDGFSIDLDYEINQNGLNYTSWTFRKAPKFFDVVTYTGTGVAGLTVSHSLDSVVGTIIVKNISRATDWMVLHRNNGSSYKNLHLNTTNADLGYLPNYWGDGTSFYQPTSTEFKVGTGTNVNFSGDTYVAYLFAHNDGDGEFGKGADQDIIKCGSFTDSTTVSVDLGFEPQWLLLRGSGITSNWWIIDNMRGNAYTSTFALAADTSSAESDLGAAGYYAPTATGFANNGFDFFGAGNEVIYIAIRRGLMKTPESGTEVFEVSLQDKNTTSFPVDMMIFKNRNGGDSHVYSRLTGGTKFLEANNTNAEMTSSDYGFDDMEGTKLSGWGTSFPFWNFRRAPGFFDVVADTGTGTAKTVNHNLGVVPELIIRKGRVALTGNNNWSVYVSSEGATKGAFLTNNAFQASSSFWNDTTPTASVFSVGNGNVVNESSKTYITYLFATVAGVSKVGSYTGNGSSQTINCGFSAGARFVLIKRTDSTSNWNVFDTERGIVAGNDPRLELNTTDAEDTGDDGVDPDSSGFAVNYIATNDDDVNVSGGTYIFLAIA